MKKRCIFLVVLLVVSFLSLPAWADLTWTTLDYPSASSTTAYGIDGNNIVGDYYDGSGIHHGFLYDGSTWTTLDYPGASGTMAYGINGTNIVGDYSDGSGFHHGFLYDGSTWTTLDYPGTDETSALGISGSNIVGNYKISNVTHGFLYDGSTWTTLDYPGATGSGAQGIRDNNIVGTYNASGFHGFLYDGSTWTTLDYPGTTFRKACRGIDGSMIVGVYALLSPTGYVAHGFLYDGSTWTTLDYPSADQTMALGISGSSIVGRYYATGSSASHGFIATLSITPTPVGYNLPWLIITFVGLTLAGGLLLRRRWAKQ